MKKTLAAAFTFVGTVIGAGFATGKEIYLFFSSCSIFSVLLAGGFLGLFCFVILQLSASFGSVFTSFAKLTVPVRIFVVFANFSVFCATIAGSESVVNDLIGVRGGAVLIAFVTLAIVLVGVRYVQIVNVLIVPVLIALVLFVTLPGTHGDISGKTSIVLPFSYASMNVVTGGFFLGETGKTFTKKQAVGCAILSGALLTALLVCVYLSVKNVSAEMPFIEQADRLGYGVVGNVILLLAMLTTAIGTLSVCVGKRKDLALPVVLLALVSSLFGFEKIVNTVYPVIGAVGGAITVFMLIRWGMDARQRMGKKEMVRLRSP